MSEKFLQLNTENEKNNEGDWLAINYPHAFILLYFIARRARRNNGHPDGLIIGDALIASTDFEPKMSRQNFRTAIEKLVELKYIKIVGNGKKFLEREKSTIKVTIKAMLVNICDSRIWDINSNTDNQRINQRLTNDQPTANHKQERRRKKKNEKENHPSIPSNSPKGLDDFSLPKREDMEIVPGVFMGQGDIDSCLKLKGSLEKVQESVTFIQNSPKRKYPISDWPQAVANWKIEDKSKTLFKEHIAYTEQLCLEFQEFGIDHGWMCNMSFDGKKDQRGILFTCGFPNNDAYFVSLTDGELKKKCEDFIKNKKMRKIS